MAKGSQNRSRGIKLAKPSITNPRGIVRSLNTVENILSKPKNAAASKTRFLRALGEVRHAGQYAVAFDAKAREFIPNQMPERVDPKMANAVKKLSNKDRARLVDHFNKIRDRPID